MYIRRAGVQAPPGMLAGNMTQLIDRAGVMRGSVEVQTVALMAAILTLS